MPKPIGQHQPMKSESARMRKIRISVLISGGGTNLQALIDACAQPDFPAQISLVLSNKADAFGLERAKKAGITTKVINHKDCDNREAFEDEIEAALKEVNTELVCLAGFMRILGADFVNGWKDRMINIHPSLLPSYKGLHTHERALEDGVRFAGCTVHYVRPEMDDGPIILQASVPITSDDTPESLAARVLEAEHKIYPEAVKLIAERRIRIRGHRAIIEDMIVPTDTIINPVIGS